MKYPPNMSYEEIAKSIKSFGVTKEEGERIADILSKDTIKVKIMKLFKRKPKKDEYYYEIFLDWDKVKTVKDIKTILKNSIFASSAYVNPSEETKKYVSVRDKRTKETVEYDINKLI